MAGDSNNLNAKQQEAIDYKNGPLLIIAGAGSGKTRTLTSRIISLINSGVAARNILAITFTNKAAGEIKKRIGSDKKESFIGTFHSFGAWILRQEAKRLNRSNKFLIFDDSDSLSLFKKIIKRYDLNKEKAKPALFRYKISRIKSLFVSPEEDENPELLKKIYSDYEESLENNNAFDFDDLIEKPVCLFQENANVLKKWQDKFRYILVDEFQDTNIVQYQMLKLLAKNHANLSVVGDDAQSIYGWRHADFRIFLNFDKDWPNAKIIKLEQNYRSTANIINAANGVIKNNKIQKEKKLWTENAAGIKVKVVAAKSEEREADWIADQASRMNLEETAILYRTNAQSRILEQALIYTRVSYQIFGGIKFYERKEIKDILAGLRLALNRKDEVSLDRLRKNFSKAKSNFLIDELPRLGDKLSTVDLINFIINNTDYADYLENNFRNYEERLENLRELINAAAGSSSLVDFLENVSLIQQVDKPQGERGVNLMTIHLSKGLEFDNVFVSGCIEGILPHEKSLSTDEQLEEERRLMYVAMTRARKNLFLSFNGFASRFLYEIPPEVVDFENLSGAAGRQEKYLPDEEEMWIEYD